MTRCVSMNLCPRTFRDDQDVGGGRGVCCQGLSEVEVHSMEDILEVVRRAQARWVVNQVKPGEPQNCGPKMNRASNWVCGSSHPKIGFFRL